MKSARHQAILDLIEKHPIDRQEDLLAHLREEGFDVTQATVSRDIRDLQLVKVADADGHYRYMPAAASGKVTHSPSRFEMIFRVNFEKGCAVLTRDGLTLYPVGKPAVTPDLPADDGYYREMLYFQSCLRAGTAPERCTPLSTMETIRIAQAEQLSADRGGERVRL